MTKNSPTLEAGKTYSKKAMLEKELAWAIQDLGEDSPSVEHLRSQIASMETIRPATTFGQDSWNAGIRSKTSQASLDSAPTGDMGDPKVMRTIQDAMNQAIHELNVKDGLVK